MMSSNSPAPDDGPDTGLAPVDPRAPLLLEVRGVHLRRGPYPALAGVSFEVASGSTTAIVGSTGAGKTSLLHAISGLAPISAGHIRFRGRDLTGLPSHRICELGIAHVPEGRQIFPSMSVRENLELGAVLPRARRGRHDRLDRILALFPRLAAAIDQDAGGLSAGEQQMVALGRGLMAQPELILFDEPARGLSPALARQLFRLIGTLEAEGLTIILAEQNASAALRLADSAHILDRGRIVLSGSGLALLEDQRVREAYL
jgi:branched-chain amino acid transport system ATP-binding protein